jgi:hypothetical protein
MIEHLGAAIRINSRQVCPTTFDSRFQILILKIFEASSNACFPLNENATS